MTNSCLMVVLCVMVTREFKTTAEWDVIRLAFLTTINLFLVPLMTPYFYMLIWNPKLHR